MTSNQTLHLDDVVIKCRKQDKAFYVKYYLSATERLHLIADASDSGCLLFEYFMRMASFKDIPEITDHAIADYFGWSTSKAKRVRLELIKTGWFRSVRFTYTDRRRGITYYLGKKTVEDSLRKPPVP